MMSCMQLIMSTPSCCRSYVDADEFEGIIKGYGIPWLMNAYVYVGNGLLVDDAVDAVNNGDDTLDDFMATVDVDRLDEVYYTEI